LDRDAGLEVLLTTGTVSAAQLMEARLPPRARHQFVPVDHPVWVNRFLDHWRPDAAIWIESELWPNLIEQAHARGIPLALVNARMSERSMRRWSGLAGSTIAQLLSRFQVRLAQTQAAALRLTELSGGRPFQCLGTLKAASPAPLGEGEAAELSALQQACGDRPVWLAASTHPGDEAMVLAVHQALLASRPDLLTVLAPRHPSRAGEVSALLAAADVPWSSRERDGIPGAGDGVFLVDRLGEMGLFYRLARVVFMAGSHTGGHGGHNPLEAAHVGRPILFGPNIENQRAAADALLQAGAAIEVADGTALAQVLADLLADGERATGMGEAALGVAQHEQQAVARIADALAAILPQRDGP